MEPVFAAFTALAVAALPLAVGVTKIVDFIRNLIDSSDTAPSWVWNAAAFVIGIVVCVGWGYNVFGALADAVPALSDSDMLDGTAGEVLTGITVGAMAGFWHEKLAAWSAQSHGTATT